MVMYVRIAQNGAGRQAQVGVRVLARGEQQLGRVRRLATK